MSKIIKAVSKKKIVYSVVLDPYVVDAHGDVISPAEVEQCAHEWLENSRFISFDHEEPTTCTVVESFIELYPTTQDHYDAHNGLPHNVTVRKFGDDTIKSGSWVIGVRLTDDLWEKVTNGEIQAFSIEGYADRKEVDQKVLPPYPTVIA